MSSSKRRFSFGTLSLTLLLHACASGPDAREQSNSLCDCIQPLDSLNTLFSDALAVEDEVRAMALLDALSAQASLSRSCLQEAKVPETTAEVKEAGLSSRLDEACPGWEAILDALPPR